MNTLEFILDHSTPKVWSAWCDGGCRGNPGPAAYGVVCADPSGKVVFEAGVFIGQATNQVAEYEGLIAAFQQLAICGAQNIHVYTDSQFVVRQFHGVYKTRDPRMKLLLDRARAAARPFLAVQLEHIPRSSHRHNQRADALANQALDAAKSSSFK